MDKKPVHPSTNKGIRRTPGMPFVTGSEPLKDNYPRTMNFGIADDSISDSIDVLCHSSQLPEK